MSDQNDQEKSPDQAEMRQRYNQLLLEVEEARMIADDAQLPQRSLYRDELIAAANTVAREQYQQHVAWATKHDRRLLSCVTFSQGGYVIFGWKAFCSRVSAEDYPQIADIITAAVERTRADRQGRLVAVTAELDQIKRLLVGQPQEPSVAEQWRDLKAAAVAEATRIYDIHRRLRDQALTVSTQRLPHKLQLGLAGMYSLSVEHGQAYYSNTASKWTGIAADTHMAMPIESFRQVLQLLREVDEARVQALIDHALANGVVD